MKPVKPSRGTTELTDSDKLLTAQHEVHQLALQFALGKAEVLDKFEEIKRDFSRQVTEIRNSLKHLADITIPPEIWMKLDYLELQLYSGEAKSKTTFEGQKTKILNALLAFEDEAINYFKTHSLWRQFGHEAEKFKLKLEVLRLRMELKTFQIQGDYKSLMEEAHNTIEKLTTKRKKVTDAGHEALDDFKEEISQAYNHIRRAVAALK